jgi:hypothetical protein
MQVLLVAIPKRMGWQAPYPSLVSSQIGWKPVPVWGAGPVRNDQIVQPFSNRFYKVMPTEMIRDHTPLSIPCTSS